MEAALKGSREIGFTVLSMSISLIAVFIPILLMGGIVGRLFREFSITLAAAIAVSLVVSLTTTPMMCARFLVSQHNRKHGKLYNWSESIFDSVVRGYGRSLGWVLKHPLPTLLVLLCTIGLNVYLYVIVPKGFFPQQDNGRLMGAIQGAQDISFPAMQLKLREIVRLVMTDPAVENVIGFTGGGSTNVARMFVQMKPLSQRGASADEVINRLRPKLASVAGATLFLQAAQDVRIGGRMSSSQYQYTLRSDSLKDLSDWSQKLLRRLRTVEEIKDPNSDQQNKGLQSMLAIDRDTASRLGVTPQLIDETLYDNFGQRQVSTMFQSLNQYFVVMEADPKLQGRKTL